MIKPKFSNIYRKPISPDNNGQQQQQQESEEKPIENLVVQLSHHISRVSSAPPVLAKTTATFKIERIFTLNSNILGLKRELHNRFGGSVDVNEFSIFHEAFDGPEILDHVKIIDLPVMKEFIPVSEVAAASHDSISSNIATSSKKRNNTQLVETDRYILALEYNINYLRTKRADYGRTDPIIESQLPKIPGIPSMVKDTSNRVRKNLVQFDPDRHFPDFLGGHEQSKRVELLREIPTSATPSQTVTPLTIFLSEPKSNQDEEFIYNDRSRKPPPKSIDNKGPVFLQNYFDPSYAGKLKHSLLYARTIQDIKSGNLIIDDIGRHYKWTDFIADELVVPDAASSSSMATSSTTSKGSKGKAEVIAAKNANTVSAAHNYPFASILTSEEEEREYYGDDRRDYDESSLKHILKAPPNAALRRKEGFGGFKWGFDSFNDVQVNETFSQLRPSNKKNVTLEMCAKPTQIIKE